MTASSLRTTHVSGLSNVIAALTQLHRERLRAAGEEHSRAQMSVMNIVAACTVRSEASRAADDLTMIGTRHPARAIVVLADPDAPAHIDADVSLRCASDAAEQVCTELLHLEVGAEAAYHLASVVTPLLVPDIPVALWLVGAPPLTQAFSPDVVAMCERIILDSGAYDDDAATLGVIGRQLERFGDGIALGDLAWERIRPWRVLLAQTFAAQAGRQLLDGVRRATLCSGERRRADALLFAGWLAAHIGGLNVDVTTEAGSPGLHQARLESDAGEVVQLEQRPSLLHASIAVEGRTVFTQAVQPPNTIDASEEAGLIIRLIADPADSATYRSAVRAASTATVLR